MIALHQLFHGYSDGHRQLAGSTRLASIRDQKRVLVLSDMSGPGRLTEAGGYLTGYPLMDSGYYAVARTWRADEMARPGCVWTHTVLITFADLASIEHLEVLNTLFVRPTIATDTSRSQQWLDAYNTPLFVDVTMLSGLSPIDLSQSLADALRELYLRPASTVIVPRSRMVNADTTLLKIWGQQWPRLRRSFRFCSLVTMDRSAIDEPFDLQFSEDLHWTVRPVAPLPDEARSLNGLSDRWLSVALHELAGASSPGLAVFLRLIGSELSAGRAAFAPLLELYAFIAANDASTVDDVIRIFSVYQADLASPKLLELVVQFALAHGGPSDTEGWAFLLLHVNTSQLASFSNDKLQSLADRFWRTARPIVQAALAEPTSFDFVSKLVLNLSAYEYAATNDALLIDIMAAMPLCASMFQFQSLPLERIESILVQAIGKSPGVAPSLLGVATRIPSALLASELFEQVGPFAVIESVNDGFEGGAFDPWIACAVTFPDALAVFLNSGKNVNFRFLEAVAETSTPDLVPNVIGPDPWLSISRAAHGELGPCLSAYLMARGFGRVSNSKNELIFLTFDQLHGYIAGSRLSNVHWRWLDAVLPELDEYRSWDRCLRLRMAVSRLALEQGMSFSSILQLTSNDQLLVALMLAMRNQSGGKQYVRSVLKDTDDVSPNNLSRARWLKDAIG